VALRWWSVLVLAAGFRILLLPVDPITSPDVHRYRWEGFIQTRGFNPYQHPPQSPALAAVASDRPHLYAAVAHPDIAAIYPPFAQLLFFLNATLFCGNLLAWKVILGAFDVLLAVSLLSSVAWRRLPPVRLILVLWCPLLLVETYEAGHIEVIAVALAALSIAAMERGRWAISALAIALSIQTKYLWPALTLVLLLAEARRIGRLPAFALISIAAALACWWPYAAGLRQATYTAGLFFDYWTFNAPFYDLMRAGAWPRWVPRIAVIIGLVGLAVLLARRGRVDLWRDSCLCWAAALLVSPVVYPWYFLWLTPMLVLSRGVGWYLWPLSVTLLYLVTGWLHITTGRWNAIAWVSWAIVVPAAGFVLSRWRERLRPLKEHSACSVSRL
jgi:hypothetical protein